MLLVVAAGSKNLVVHYASHEINGNQQKDVQCDFLVYKSVMEAFPLQV